MNGFYKKTVSLTVIMILCQVINLLRDILLAKNLGASNLNDIYLVSQTIISLLVSMINSPLATAYVPVATDYFVKKSIKERNKFVSRVYTDIFVFSLLAIMIEFVLLDFLLDIVAPGFSSQDHLILKNMIILQFPIIIFNLIKGVNKGNLQILQKYNISEITNVMPYMLMVIYLFIFSKNINLYYISIVLAIGSFLSVIPEIIILYKNGFRFSFNFGYNKDIKIMLKLMISAAIVAGVREVNVLCDKAIGSLLAAGSITMLSYASKVTVVAVGIISTAISVVGFSNIAKFRAKNEKQKILSSIVESCNLINFFLIPLMCYLILFSKDIITLLFGGNSFGEKEIAITSQLMVIYALGLIGYGFQDVFTRALHAHKIVKCTIKISILMVSINVISNLLLYKIIGVYGVAFSTSISILLIIPILFVDVQKYIGKINIKRIFKEMIKCVIVSLLTVVIGVISKHYLVFDSFMITFLTQTIICIFVYLILSICFKCEAIKNLLKELIVLK